MAEFDRGGFAAVDAFFGGGEEESTTKQTVHDETTVENNVGHRHLGLGATPSSAKTDKSKLGLNKRILQVGKKRQRDVISDDDDKSAVSEEGEDDLGRTTAIDQRPSAAVPVSAVTLAKNVAIAGKKSKKKGKKERALDKATRDLLKNEKAVATKNEKPIDNESSAINDEGRSKKRKRRKVRSRQKNIYKDKREKKPEHLVPGNKNYQGRPLTAETRTKLNLSSTIPEQVKESRGDWESSWTEGPQDGAIDALPLAVDVPREDWENSGARSASTTPPLVKKSKYKNLR